MTGLIQDNTEGIINNLTIEQYMYRSMHMIYGANQLKNTYRKRYYI
jgi:hypothetical protein